MDILCFTLKKLQLLLGTTLTQFPALKINLLAMLYGIHIVMAITIKWHLPVNKYIR